MFVSSDGICLKSLQQIMCVLAHRVVVFLVTGKVFQLTLSIEVSFKFVLSLVLYVIYADG